MSYRNQRFYRSSNKPRDMVAKYAGTCACCGVPIAAGEMITYYPDTKRITHIAASWDAGERVSTRCVSELRKREYPEYHAELVRREHERRAINDYAGDGLDERYEDSCRDACGL